MAAVSGGADSTTLLHLLVQWRNQGGKFSLMAAHYNHLLRPDSFSDQRFVEKMCGDLSVNFVTENGNVRAEAARTKRSVHDVARQMRYEFLLKVANNHSAGTVKNNTPAVIATGHHFNDQVETVLMRLFSGSGVDGLSGIRQNLVWDSSPNVRIIRPLIQISKSELVNYCDANSIEYIQDETNLDNTFPRSRLRNEILPLIEEQFGKSAYEGISRSAELFNFTSELIAVETDKAFDNAVVKQSQSEVVLDYERFKSYLNILRQNCILKATRHLTEKSHRITCERCQAAERHIVSQNTGIIEMGGDVKITVFDAKVWFFKTPVSFSTTEISIPGQLTIPGWGQLEGEICKKEEIFLPPSSGVLYISKDKLNSETLTVEMTQAGDKFNPYGMKGSRKVSDFLHDAHVPPFRRKAYPVVKSGGHIVAIQPFRIADRVKITDETSQVIKLTWRDC